MTKQIKYDEYAGYRSLTDYTGDNADLYLTHCGMELCSPRHCWGWGSRPDYHMHFILNGTGVLEIHNHTNQLHRGQIFILPPDTLVKYYADQSDPWYYSWVSFNGKKANEYLYHAGFSHDDVVRDCLCPPEDFTAIIHRMLQANTTEAYDSFERTGGLYQLFSLLIRSNTASSAPGNISADTYVQYARNYIEYHYNHDIHIADIADYLQINRSYFSTCFKKVMNCSPKEYLLRYRMEKAKDLLTHTSMSVADIAQKTGYTAPSVFSKTFSRQIGQSPSVYRSTGTPAKD